jgi:hypothetical protein
MTPAGLRGPFDDQPHAVVDGIFETDTCYTNLEPLIGLWDGWRGRRKLPLRKNLEPAQIGTLLSNVLLLDVKRNPIDFHYLVCGQHFIDHNGYDLTGHRLSEFVADTPSNRELFKFYAAVSQDGRPRTLRVSYTSRKSIRKHAHLVALPFAGVRGQVTALLVGLAYVDPE